MTVNEEFNDRDAYGLRVRVNDNCDSLLLQQFPSKGAITIQTPMHTDISIALSSLSKDTDEAHRDSTEQLEINSGLPCEMKTRIDSLHSPEISSAADPTIAPFNNSPQLTVQEQPKL